MSHQSLTKVSKHPTWSSSTQNDKMHWLNSVILNILSLSPENGLNCSSFALCLCYRLLCTDYWGENERRLILLCDEWYHTVKVEIFSSHQHQCKGWFISIRPYDLLLLCCAFRCNSIKGIFSQLADEKPCCLSSLDSRANLHLRKGTYTREEWTVAREGSMSPSWTDVCQFVWLTWQTFHLNSGY